MRRAKAQGRRWTRKGTGASWAMPLSCLQLRPSPSIRVQLLSDLISRKNITLYYISRTGKKQPVRIYFLPVRAEDEAASEGRKKKASNQLARRLNDPFWVARGMRVQAFCRRQNLEPARIHFLPVGEISARNQRNASVFTDAFLLSGRRGSTRCRIPGKAGAFPGQAPPGLKKSGLHPDFVVEVSSSRERNKKKRLTNWLDA